MHRAIRGTLGLILFMATSSLPWLAIAQDQPKATEIKPSELRFYLESPGQCRSTGSGKSLGLAACGEALFDMRHVDGARKLLFGDKDLVAFVGNETDLKREGDDSVQPINWLEVKQGDAPIVRYAAEGTCVRKKLPDNQFLRTECSASTQTPPMRVEYTFVASGGAKLSYTLNVPTDNNRSVDILINMPARMVANMWKRGESSRATQTSAACFRQAQDLRNFHMFFQCISVASAADYLRTTTTPGSDAVPPELPITFLNDVQTRFNTTFETKSGKPLDIEQMVRAHYSGSVWAVRGAYGAKLNGYSSSSSK